MTIVTSDACIINFLWEHNWQLIDDTKVMFQLVASFRIVIYNQHMFIVQTIGARPFCLLGNLPIGHFYSLQYGQNGIWQLAISWMYNILYMDLNTLAILSNCHFGCSPFCQLGIWSTFHNVNLMFHQLPILWTCHIVNFLLHRLAILSTWCFTNLPFY